MMKAVIIEDENIIAKALQSKLHKLAPDVEVVAILSSLKTANHWFEAHAAPDVLFMDIQLSDGVSFDLFKNFTLECPIIFTTAYDDYAIRAFKVNSIDYLLKPVKEAELLAALDKCRKLLAKDTKPPVDIANLLHALDNRTDSVRYKEKFIVHVRHQWRPVDTRDIACFSKEVLNYLYLHNGEKYMIDYVTLDEVEELLDPRQFYRATRQVILNIDAIATVKPLDNAKLIVHLKEPNHKIEIEMSRLKSPEFKKWLDR